MDISDCKWPWFTSEMINKMVWDKNWWSSGTGVWAVGNDINPPISAQTIVHNVYDHPTNNFRSIPLVRWSNPSYRRITVSVKSGENFKVTWSGQGGVTYPVNVDIAVLFVDASSNDQIDILYSVTVSKPSNNTVTESLHLPAFSIDHLVIDPGDEILITLRAVADHTVPAWVYVYDDITIQVVPLIDLNLDCSIDILDLATLCSQWLHEPNIPSADIAPYPNGDNIVNIRDYAFLASHWYDDDMYCNDDRGHENTWNIKWFHCDDGHENDRDLNRDGTPICGTGNCPGDPGTCWGETKTQQFGSFPDISWSTGPKGEICLSYAQDYQVYGDTYLYTDIPTTIIVPISCDVCDLWLNDSKLEFGPPDHITLNLISGWNHFEWTAYNQNQSSMISLNYPIADDVDLMISSSPE